MMIGSTYQMVKIVSYVKKTVRDGADVPLEMPKSIRSISFTFADGRSFSGKENEPAESIRDWCRLLRQKGLRDIRIYISAATNDPKMAGYANGQAESIVTACENGTVTCWFPSWSYDDQTEAWNIHYTEVLWGNMRMEYLDQEDPTEDFKATLKDIGKLADEIGCHGYAWCFGEAYAVLNGKKPAEAPEWMQKDLYLFNPDTMRLLLAAEKANHFGGMGSWNDSPPYYAHDVGRDGDYDQLSHELYVRIQQAIMYAVNQ